MQIQFLGQSCFLITDSRGVRILTDPFSSGIGLKMPKTEADLVTLSHDHYDHNNTAAVQGHFECLKEPGAYEVKGIHVRGLSAYHDKEQGKKRGKNVIFLIEADGLKICHLGDLGHVPDDALLAQIGTVDILLIPIGEVFTFSVDEAVKTMRLIKPALTIPMHYKVRKLTLGLEPPEKFIRLAGDVRREGSGTLDVTPRNLKENSGIVLLENG